MTTEPATGTERHVLGACPLDCPDTCGWVVTVRDGQAVGLRGNPDHPFTRGALCVKVNRWLEHATEPDRILHPLRRVGPKGAGRFERITWDEALDEIATRLDGVLAEYGGEAIWPFWGCGTLGYLQGLEGFAGRRFFNLLGASDHDPTICSVAGTTGLKYTIGASAGLDPEDLAKAKLIILWGANTLTSGHHLWKFVQDARRDGAYVVAIDPIRTRTAQQADEHLAPIPGTDAALALGLLNVVVRLGAEDSDFLERHTLGWPEFRDRIAEYPPERVAEITGLDVARITALGERVARTRPTAIRAAMGMQRHAGGGTALRTLACIPGVTGDWARQGGGVSYSTSGHFKLNKLGLYRDDLRRGPVRTLSMTRVGANLLDLDDPPVKALFVIAANPMASNPGQHQVRRGLAREDLFTVVLEQFPTDTADYADIVLPATMQHEHMDLHEGYGQMYLAWNEPAVAPPGECLPTTETFRRLARRMGLTEPSLYDSDEDLAAQLLDSGHPYLTGITLDRLRKEGFAKLSVPEPFVPYAEGFPTPSGRLEFRSARADRDGLGALPDYVPPAEVADAAARELADGDLVSVFNERGGFEAVVEVSDRVQPGVVATSKGHWAKFTGGATANAAVAERDADMGGGAVYHDTRVEVTPVS